MVRRVTELTPAQRDRMESHAQGWIDRGWRITPLTESEWAVWEDGARYFYELAKIPFPKTIVRVPSPMVGAFAAPIVAYVLAKLRKDGVIPRSAVRSAVGSAVGSAVDSAVDSAVGSAVRSAVGSAVDSDEREVLSTIRQSFYRWMGGRFGGWGFAYNWATSPWWLSYWTFFRDVAGLELEGDLWERVTKSEAASSAGYWWPFDDFVMVCDNPVELHVETAGGEKRMHCETGPAISWADGYGIYMWHGVQVPAWVIHEPTVDRALKEPNSEVRRAALEHIGWPKVIAQLGTKPIATCADPGNDPHELALYSLPEAFYDEPVNLLVMTNGSPDRSGEQRLYGETVPANIIDPLAAAAWQYGVAPDVYANLARRT